MTDFVFAINNETLLISLSGWLVFLRKFTAERNKKFYGRKSSLRASRYVEKVDNRLWKINNQSLDAREDEAWKAFLGRDLWATWFDRHSKAFPYESLPVGFVSLVVRRWMRVANTRSTKQHKLRRNRWTDPVGTNGWISYMLSGIDKFIGNDLRPGNLAQSLPTPSKCIYTRRPSKPKWNDL